VATRDDRLILLRGRQREYLDFLQRVRAFRRSVLAFQSLMRDRPRNGVHSAANGRANNEVAQAMPSVKSPLTERQMEIADLIARGYTNVQIADALVLTPGTVANHVQHILERLNVRSRTQVAVWYSQARRAVSQAHDASGLELEAGQTTGLHKFARDTQQKAVMQALGDELSKRRIRPRWRVDQDA
jgi:DNA-binding CsgD family transcriptional regulator